MKDNKRNNVPITLFGRRVCCFLAVVVQLLLLSIRSGAADANTVVQRCDGQQDDLHDHQQVESTQHAQERRMLRSHGNDNRARLEDRDLVSVDTLELHKKGANIHEIGETKTTTSATTNASSSSSSMMQPVEDKYLGIVPRAFDPWPSDRPLPCVPSEPNWIEWKVQDSPAKEGFLYSKLYKTGSSTLSGIDLRIARNVANRTAGIPTGMCKCRYDHGPFYNPALRFQQRNKMKSFLWSVVREPTHRLTSLFFHMEVSRKKNDPTDPAFQRFVLSDNPEVKPYYLKIMYPYFETVKHTADAFDPVTLGNQIMQEYDFIGVTERMDEVAVLIMMLLDLPMADILFLDAKHHGGYDDGGGEEHTCTYIWPSFVSKGMKTFFESHQWKEFIKWDLAVYEAANRSMDLTIERLGVKKFQANLEQFRHAQQVAVDQCLETTRFPCSEGGTKNPETDCLWDDSGCGAVCLDKVATQLDLW